MITILLLVALHIAAVYGALRFAHVMRLAHYEPRRPAVMLFVAGVGTTVFLYLIVAGMFGAAVASAIMALFGLWETMTDGDMFFEFGLSNPLAVLPNEWNLYLTLFNANWRLRAQSR